ncbi:MAG: S-adenosyl-l-methionine hydroxide adenosyltransferase family protein [Actinomycetota bacterium]
MHNHVSLLTDYGLDDEFVGVVKSVIVDLAPHVRITDITHGIAAFDVRAGSLALARAIQYVPAGIVIAVVDPGGGAERRAIAVEVEGGPGILLGPDNGLLAPATAMAGGAERAFVLSNTDLHLEAPGATFAGRDVFAPVAAHLCNGGVLEDVGEEIDTALVMPGIVPVASRESHPRHGEGLRCEVTWVDTFGNCQLNAGVEDIESFGSQLRLVIPGGTEETIRSARVATHFAVIGDGAVGLVIDSYGMLAVAVDRGSAAAQLSLGAGDAVLLFAGEDRGPEAPVTLRTTR